MPNLISLFEINTNPPVKVGLDTDGSFHQELPDNKSRPLTKDFIEEHGIQKLFSELLEEVGQPDLKSFIEFALQETPVQETNNENENTVVDVPAPVPVPAPPPQQPQPQFASQKKKTVETPAPLQKTPEPPKPAAKTTPVASTVKTVPVPVTTPVKTPNLPPPAPTKPILKTTPTKTVQESVPSKPEKNGSETLKRKVLKASDFIDDKAIESDQSQIRHEEKITTKAAAKEEKANTPKSTAPKTLFTSSTPASTPVPVATPKKPNQEQKKNFQDALQQINQNMTGAELEDNKKEEEQEEKKQHAEKAKTKKAAAVVPLKKMEPKKKEKEPEPMEDQDDQEEEDQDDQEEGKGSGNDETEKGVSQEKTETKRTTGKRKRGAQRTETETNGSESTDVTQGTSKNLKGPVSDTTKKQKVVEAILTSCDIKARNIIENPNKKKNLLKNYPFSKSLSQEELIENAKILFEMAHLYPIEAIKNGVKDKPERDPCCDWKKATIDADIDKFKVDPRGVLVANFVYNSYGPDENFAIGHHSKSEKGITQTVMDF